MAQEFNSMTSNLSMTGIIDPATDLSGLEPELAQWLKEKKMPKIIVESLRSNGFEFLDIVLEMTDDEMDSLDLKLGHKKYLQKCIQGFNTAGTPQVVAPKLTFPESFSEKIPPPKSTTTKSSLHNWLKIEKMFDDSILTSGSMNTEKLKVWSKMTKEELLETLREIRMQGDRIKDDPKVIADVKKKCMYTIAMVLASAFDFENAEKFCRLTLDTKAPGDYNEKLLLMWIIQMRLLQPLWHCKKDDVCEYEELQTLYVHMLEQKKHLSDAQLCKVHLIGTFAFESVIEQDRDNSVRHLKSAKTALSKAKSLCQEHSFLGLLAEATSIEGNLMDTEKRAFNIQLQRRDGLSFYKEARNRTLNEYGEYSTLMARIYNNLGIVYEERQRSEKAYECFRRAWLIRRQLFGLHHPSTKKSAAVVTEYKKMATDLDTLPEDDEMSNKKCGPTKRDLQEYHIRIGFLNE